MTKAAFIENIRQITSYLPVNEREKYVEYYSEMIDDAVEDGMSEEEAVASLGTIEEISAYIRENSAQSIQSPAPESVVREKKHLPVWAIVLIVLGFPIWFSLLCAVFSIYISGWAVIISLFAADISIFAAGIVSVPALFMVGSLAKLLITLGLGLFCLGLSGLMFIGLVKLSELYVKFTVFIVRKTVDAMKEVF